MASASSARFVAPKNTDRGILWRNRAWISAHARAASIEWPAKREKVVLQPHAVDAQHSLPDFGQDPLSGSSRRDIFGAALLADIQLQGQQRLAVHFSVGRARNLVERDKELRNHERWQSLCQLFSHFPDRRARRLPGHDEGDELRFAAVAGVRKDRGFEHVRPTDQCGFDLEQFDSVAADLDLLIDAPPKLQLAVRTDPAEIARAVQPVARFGRKRMRHESLGGRGRTIQIAAGQSRPAHIHFADLARREEIQLAVKQLHERALYGASDARAIQPSLAGHSPDNACPDSVVP